MKIAKPQEAARPIHARVRQILESARTNVARSVNAAQVVANWLIGREILKEEQHGRQRAEYGKKLVEELAAQLQRDFGKGYSALNPASRPPEGNIPIYWRGRNYNPDFIIETADTKCLVEVKRRKEIGPPMDTEVKEKALAAQRWCQTASGIPGGKPWEYKLIPDDAIDAANDFRFTVSQARRFD